MLLKKISSVLLILAMSLPPSFVRAEETVATETIEVAATEVSVCCEGDTHKLVLQVKNGPEYLLEGAPYTYQNETKFLALSDIQKEKFISIRGKFLAKTVAVLHSTRILYGVGSLVKDKITHTFKTAWGKTKSLLGRSSDVAAPIEDFAVEIASAELQSEKPEAPRFRERVNQRSHEIVSQILKSIDRKLWDQSELVVTKNETSVKASIGVIGINAAGFKGKGWGYAIGIHLGYNSSSRALVFEFYTESETTLVAYTPTLLYALAPKIGYSMNRINPENPAMQRAGESFYTPGAPLYVTNLENSFSTGLNSSIVGTPGGDAFAYLNTVNQRILLRFSISPLRPFFRKHTGSLFSKKSCAEQLK